MKMPKILSWNSLKLFLNILDTTKEMSSSPSLADKSLVQQNPEYQELILILTKDQQQEAEANGGEEEGEENEQRKQHSKVPEEYSSFMTLNSVSQSRCNSFISDRTNRTKFFSHKNMKNLKEFHETNGKNSKCSKFSFRDDSDSTVQSFRVFERSPELRDEFESTKHIRNLFVRVIATKLLAKGRSNKTWGSFKGTRTKEVNFLCPVCRKKRSTTTSNDCCCQCLVDQEMEELKCRLKGVPGVDWEQRHKRILSDDLREKKIHIICKHCSKEHLADNLKLRKYLHFANKYEMKVRCKVRSLRFRAKSIASHIVANNEKSMKSAMASTSSCSLNKFNEEYLFLPQVEQQQEQRHHQHQHHQVEQEEQLEIDENKERYFPKLFSKSTNVSLLDDRNDDRTKNNDITHTSSATSQPYMTLIHFTQFFFLFIPTELNNLIIYNNKNNKYNNNLYMLKANKTKTYSIRKEEKVKYYLYSLCCWFTCIYNIYKFLRPSPLSKRLIQTIYSINTCICFINRNCKNLLLALSFRTKASLLSIRVSFNKSLSLLTTLSLNFFNILHINKTCEGPQQLSPPPSPSQSHSKSTVKFSVLPKCLIQHKSHEQPTQLNSNFEMDNNSCKMTSKGVNYRSSTRNVEALPSKLWIQKHIHCTKFNNSLIILSFLIFMLPLTFAQSTIQSSTNRTSSLSSSLITSPVEQNETSLLKTEVACKSMDLRNSPASFKAIENCTVIDGFLFVGLVNAPVDNLSFPLLTEVTEYVLVYRLKVRSLGQLFPNLAVIRGRAMFEGYSLVLFNNPSLEEIGLSKLLAISRGGVRIEQNVNLCYVNSIDWKQILFNTTEQISISENKNEQECPKCPGSNKVTDLSSPNALVCNEHNGARRCWNGQSCQKICPPQCPGNCFNSTTCCDSACIGGCTTNPNKCVACRNFSIKNQYCINKCPKGYFEYLTRRCITAENCLKIRTKYENSSQQTLVPFNGTCTTTCPEGYQKVNSTCVECDGGCVKPCEGAIIDSVTRAKEFSGCNEIVKQGLIINIKLGGPHVYQELEHAFGAIKVIRTFLKVQRTYAVTSLGFFSKLENITGEVLDENKYALYVLENNDLEKIWNENQKVYINRGRVFFHFNQKLCYSTIEKIRPMLTDNRPFDKNEVATDSNGSRGSCNTIVLKMEKVNTTSLSAAMRIANPMSFPDNRTFIGYLLLHREAPQNVTKHSWRPCDDSWTIANPQKEIKFNITHLKPYTRYAYYVKTMTISSETMSGESDIEYFWTMPDKPGIVRYIATHSNSSSEIVVSWMPPKSVNGELDVYTIQAKIVKPDNNGRDFCKEPAVAGSETKSENDIILPPFRIEKGSTDPNCDCAGGKEPGTAAIFDENVDTTRHIEIDFENAIQNFVYIKKTAPRNRRSTEGLPKESLLIRTARALAKNEIEKHIDTKAEENEMINLKTIQPVNHSDSEGKYTEFAVNVSKTLNQYVLKGLKHFTQYSISIRACRKQMVNDNASYCSDDVIRQARTKKLENVDRVENFAIEEVSNSSVRLRWDPPKNPNGEIVSYTISYRLDAQDSVDAMRCILKNESQNFYNLVGLSPGKYTVMVRVNTLAGYGHFSETLDFFIKMPKMEPLSIIIIVFSIILFLVFMGCTMFFLRKKFGTPPDLTIIPTVNPYYISQPYVPDEWEVPRERIILLTPLGQGSFGMVYEGILKGTDDRNEDIPCAIKTVNESATISENNNFLQEASIMKEFDTHHVVRLFGVCSRTQPALVVMELMKRGDLKTYLRNHRPENNRDETVLSTFGQANTTEPPPSLNRILLMALQIADGMAYLAAKKFVHRDLAARNCMVAQDLNVKIGDFGMTRDIYATDYYRKGTKGLLPVRWMAPESLKDGVYSSESDVFSYGVVLWEMATLAAQPYQGLSNDQVLRYVIDGGVMERPEDCPDILYNLMQKCWHHRPSARPTFLDIIERLLHCADEHFHEVSFYHSPVCQEQHLKERKMFITDDQDNNMDDATTPLHPSDFNGYKLNLANNGSADHVDESPIITAEDDEDHLHSPHSLVSGIINSASDGQSKNSFNLSHKLHGPSSGPPQYISNSNIQNMQNFPFQYRPAGRPSFPQLPQDDNNANNTDTDDIGYEVYDPSPNYRGHGGSYGYQDDDDEDDEMDGKLLSGGQNLLPIPKNGNKRMPHIISMSSPMPSDSNNDDLMVSSSLHPSTASAGSSNASSTTVAGPTGKIQMFKDAAVRLRFPRFNHKRSNSNSSHKSTNSNAGRNQQQQPLTKDEINSGAFVPHTLSTIESGGSGSAGSYCATPSNKKNTSSSSFSTPGYKPLNDSENMSIISSTPYHQHNQNSSGPKSSAVVGGQKTKPSPVLNFFNNPSLFNKSFAELKENDSNHSMNFRQLSENPNYGMMTDLVSSNPSPPASSSNLQKEEPFQKPSVPLTTTPSDPTYTEMMPPNPLRKSSLAQSSEENDLLPKRIYKDSSKTKPPSKIENIKMTSLQWLMNQQFE